MTAANPNEEEFIEAQIAVVTVRLLIGGMLWCIAVALLDRTTAPTSDPYIANMRIALWLFLVEVLIGVYFVRYTAPRSYPLFKRAAFVIAESCTQAWRMAIYVALNLTLRWLFVTLLTAGAIYLVGTNYLNCGAAIIPSLSFFIACLYGVPGMAKPPVIRGTHLGSYEEAIYRAAKLVLITRLAIAHKLQDKGIDPSELRDVQVHVSPWGGVLLPTVVQDPHYLLIGTTGAGKTLLIRMMLKSAFFPFGGFSNRALIYDGKREYIPLLMGMGIPSDKLLIMNPADARCVAWDMAKDVHNRDDAVNLVHILIPEDKNANENPFFIRAVRSLVTEAMMALHSLAPGQWRLIDLVNALRTPKRMKRVLGTTKEGKQAAARYFTEAKEAVGGIISTVDARFITDYETIARVWARCDRSVSLVNWMKDQSILLLGYDANRQSVDRINQAIFQRASQLICSLPEAGEGNQRHTWVLLDEVRFTGKLPMLPELMSFGRTKNTHVVLAPQDIDGLIDVYGEHQVNEMLGLCGNVGVLRLTSPKTRDWAAKFFGDAEAWEQETSHSTTQGGTSSNQGDSRSWSETWGTSNRRVKRESVLPSEFLNLPPTNRENGLHGFFFTPAMGAWRAQVPPAFIDEHLPPSDPEGIAFIPRSDFVVEPMHWTRSEEERFTRSPDRGNGKDNPSTDPTEPEDGAEEQAADATDGDKDQNKKTTNKKNTKKKDDNGNNRSNDDDKGKGPLPKW